jgi:hypothetical protein
MRGDLSVLVPPRPTGRFRCAAPRRVLAILLLGALLAPAALTFPGSRAAASEAPAPHWSNFSFVQAGSDERECWFDATRPVPELVADIFRCRLAGHLAPEEVPRVVAEAVVVAECESLFDAHALVFEGRYVDRPHPRTGLRYTAAGVFQFIRATAEHYVDGGYEAATDPVANINGAVTLYLENRANGGRGWESWECSAVNGAFKARSVLPGWPGGPDHLPDWAWQY